jgi:hypothetical protein
MGSAGSNASRKFQLKIVLARKFQCKIRSERNLKMNPRRRKSDSLGRNFE